MQQIFFPDTFRKTKTVLSPKKDLLINLLFFYPDA